MIRIAIALACVVLLTPASAVATTPSHRPFLERYVVAVDVQIRSYRSLLQRFERLFSEPPHVNVDPFVESLYRLADRFEHRASRWSGLKAPHGLRVRHRGMGRVFKLFAEALRIHAAAVFTRHPDEILGSRARTEPRYRSAAYLQKRWAAALQGALIRAELRVPRWLHAMATVDT